MVQLLYNCTGCTVVQCTVLYIVSLEFQEFLESGKYNVNTPGMGVSLVSPGSPPCVRESIERYSNMAFHNSTMINAINTLLFAAEIVIHEENCAEAHGVGLHP